MALNTTAASRLIYSPLSNKLEKCSQTHSNQMHLLELHTHCCCVFQFLAVLVVADRHQSHFRVPASVNTRTWRLTSGSHVNGFVRCSLLPNRPNSYRYKSRRRRPRNGGRSVDSALLSAWPAHTIRLPIYERAGCFGCFVCLNTPIWQLLAAYQINLFHRFPFSDLYSHQTLAPSGKLLFYWTPFRAGKSVGICTRFFIVSYFFPLFDPARSVTLFSSTDAGKSCSLLGQRAQLDSVAIAAYDQGLHQRQPITRQLRT